MEGALLFGEWTIFKGLNSDAWGNLEGSIETEPKKITVENFEKVQLPNGKTEDEIAGAIVAGFRSYDNSVPYTPFGDKKLGLGNSNSITGSVLRYAGVDYRPRRGTVGYYIDVLPSQRASAIARRK